MEDENQENGKKFSEKVKEQAVKVKQHVRDNKTTYFVGAGCLVAGYLLRRQLSPAVPALVNTINNNPVFNNTVNNGGYMRKIVRCLETDEMWPSMTKAAEAAGHSLKTMSQHIHGHTESLDGLHYVIEGLAAS